MKNKSEINNVYFRNLIWKNAVCLFEKKSSMTDKSIIKSQKNLLINLI